MNKKNAILILSIVVFFLIASCNNKQPFKPPYKVASGYVIGKENCNADTGKNYWLIEIVSSPSATQQYGDTLTLNGVKYNNLIKTTGLSESLEIVGEKVGFDFNISGTATLTVHFGKSGLSISEQSGRKIGCRVSHGSSFPFEQI